MFYCDKCAKKYGYPVTMSKSVGNCECCGKQSECNERPSYLLPIPVSTRKEMPKKQATTRKRIKTFEEACERLNISSKLPSVATFPEQFRKYVIAHYKLMVIAQALNGKWKPDFGNDNQNKYVPVFALVPGVGFRYNDYDIWIGHTDAGSRLCFRTEKLAKYAGTQFEDLYNEYLSNDPAKIINKTLTK